jgi:hypothetical protein
MLQGKNVSFSFDELVSLNHLVIGNALFFNSFSKVSAITEMQM